LRHPSPGPSPRLWSVPLASTLIPRPLSTTAQCPRIASAQDPNHRRPISKLAVSSSHVLSQVQASHPLLLPSAHNWCNHVSTRCQGGGGTRTLVPSRTEPSRHRSRPDTHHPSTRGPRESSTSLVLCIQLPTPRVVRACRSQLRRKSVTNSRELRGMPPRSLDLDLDHGVSTRNRPEALTRRCVRETGVVLYKYLVQYKYS
jgi:hypothetical protein